MTKGDLERLERAGMITNLQEFKKKVSRASIRGYEYYDIEAEMPVIAIYDISDLTLAELQANNMRVKLRRLERD